MYHRTEISTKEVERMIRERKREKGLDLLKKLQGGKVDEQQISNLAEVSPKMAEMVIEWVLGDLYQSREIDLKTREWIILAVLITQGHWTQVKAHVEAALNLGATRAEIVEMMNLTAIYAGFPAAVNALLAAKEVFTSE